MARTKRTNKRASMPVDAPEGVGVDLVITPPRKKQKGEDKLEKKPHLGDEIRAGWPVPFARAREEILAGVGHWHARPSSEEWGEGTSGGVVSDAESILRGEILRLSHLVEKKDVEVARLRASLSAERERRWENEAIIEALADSHESNREQDMSEAMRIRLESDLLTLRAEVDRLQTSEAEARGECDRAFAERAASAARVDELHARLRSFEVPAQGGAIVASIPPPLSLGEEKALLHDQYAQRMDRMALHHEREVADLRRRLDRYRQRAEERGYAFSDSFRAPSQRAPGPSSFASSAIHDGAAP